MGFWTSFCCPFKSPCLGSTKLILFYFKTTLVCYTFILKEISLNVRFSERWLNGGRPTGDVMSEKRGNPLDSRRMTSWPDLWKHCEAAAVLRSEICSVSPGNNTWRRNTPMFSWVRRPGSWAAGCEQRPLVAQWLQYSRNFTSQHTFKASLSSSGKSLHVQAKKV